MPTTGQTVTTMMARDAVAAAINSPADSTIWGETIGSCVGGWIHAPNVADLANVYITVIAISRDRGQRQTETPDKGRTARGLIASAHRVVVKIQGAVATDPPTRDQEIDELAAFAQQVQDYFSAKHRTVTISGTLATGDPFSAQCNVYPASPIKFDVGTVETHAVFTAELELEVWVTERW